MNTKLIEFHRNCADEFNVLLNDFNLLFYGYGCKQNLLKELFPSGKIYNCKFLKLQNIIEDLVIDGYATSSGARIADIDNDLHKKGKSLLLICINFNFEMHELKGLKAIKIIGTLENIEFDFDKNDIEEYNFIFRDLTTFENYSEEIIDIDIHSNKVNNTIMVYKGVPNKSRTVFKELLSTGSCYLTELYDKLKTKLMLSKKNALVDLLHEFIDHGIVKVVDGVNINVCLNKDERKKLMENPELKND